MRTKYSEKNPSALPVFKTIIARSFHEIINPDKRVLTQVKEMAHKKDVPILAAAVKGEADILVTFNKKDFFPDLSLTIDIVNPGELLRIIQRLN